MAFLLFILFMYTGSVFIEADPVQTTSLGNQVIFEFNVSSIIGIEYINWYWSSLAQPDSRIKLYGIKYNPPIGMGDSPIWIRKDFHYRIIGRMSSIGENLQSSTYSIKLDNIIKNDAGIYTYEVIVSHNHILQNSTFLLEVTDIIQKSNNMPLIMGVIIFCCVIICSMILIYLVLFKDLLNSIAGFNLSTAKQKCKLSFC